MWSFKNIFHSFQLRHASIGAHLPDSGPEAEKTGSAPQQNNRAAARQAVFYARESDFLTQDTFREVLCFERKRAERSRKPLGLLLLDLDSVSSPETKTEIARSLGRASIGMQQAGPIKGWYKQHSILGIIVTETDEKGMQELREKILDELPVPLSEQLSKKLMYHCFPFAPGAGDGSNGETCSLFYPGSAKEEKSRRVSLFLKRVMDIVGGFTGVVLFAPLFIIFGLLIKITSKGPILFKQERIGRHGEKFVFLKFRTMFANNDSTIHQEYIKKLILEQKSYDNGTQDKGSVYKIHDDPRVTAVGRLLRKTSLDELPQFFNVLFGDMSIVGPRPPIPYELESYDLWHRRRVMEIKPGLTGLWQVSGRSSTTFDEMVRLDLKYAKEWSLWLDIKIILKTPWVVLTGKGGY